MLENIQKYSGVVTLILVVTILFFVSGAHHAFGALSTPGSSVVPTTLSGGSVPSLFSALEASESFISDGPVYILATTTESSATSASSAVTGPVYESKGGATYAYVNVSYAATSSVPVSVPNPFGTATSSIDSVICKTTGGVTGANTFDLSTSTTAFGSSTPALIYAHSIASGAVDTFIWKPRVVASTSVSIANSVFTADNTKDGLMPFILGPSQIVNLRIATTSAGTFATYYTGSCAMQFSR